MIILPAATLACFCITSILPSRQPKLPAALKQFNHLAVGPVDDADSLYHIVIIDEKELLIVR